MLRPACAALPTADARSLGGSLAQLLRSWSFFHPQRGELSATSARWSKLPLPQELLVLGIFQGQRCSIAGCLNRSHCCGYPIAEQSHSMKRDLGRYQYPRFILSRDILFQECIGAGAMHLVCYNVGCEEVCLLVRKVQLSPPVCLTDPPQVRKPDSFQYRFGGEP